MSTPQSEIANEEGSDLPGAQSPGDTPPVEDDDHEPVKDGESEEFHSTSTTRFASRSTIVGVIRGLPWVGGEPAKDSLDETAGAVEQTASEDEIQRAILDGEDDPRPTARDRSLPQDEFLIYDRLTKESTLAQDTLGFDYVRSDGIIVDGDAYVGLVTVQPRNWLVLNDAERVAVFKAFMSFLLGLNYPIQILAIPREFDISTHTEQIQLADSQSNRSEDSPILRHGRQRQIAWLHNTIDTMSVKDRDFFVVTRVHADHVSGPSQTNGLPILGRLPAFPVQSLFRHGIRRRRKPHRSEARCVKEVRARQIEVSETITKTGVSTRIISDRDETMDILYQHYNHVESPFSTYNHATYTKLLANAFGEAEAT